MRTTPAARRLLSVIEPNMLRYVRWLRQIATRAGGSAAAGKALNAAPVLPAKGAPPFPDLDKLGAVIGCISNLCVIQERGRLISNGTPATLLTRHLGIPVEALTGSDIVASEGDVETFMAWADALMVGIVSLRETIRVDATQRAQRGEATRPAMNAVKASALKRAHLMAEQQVVVLRQALTNRLRADIGMTTIPTNPGLSANRPPSA